jgi:hypothetical protein
MVVSLFDRSHSRSRGLRRKPASNRSRRNDDQRIRLAIDELESRRALAITGVLSIGGQTVGSFTDAQTGEDSLGDFVTVSIEGTRGTVIFNGVTDPLALSVPDNTNINTIQIIDASPDFQLTFNGVVRTGTAVPYASDGVVQMGRISTSDVIRGINSVRGPLTNVAITTDPPIGFTQSGGAIGSNVITLAGNQTSFEGEFVCATPLTLGGTLAGSPVFANVTVASYNAGTDTTLLTLSNPTGGTTAQGALTLATARGVEFQLSQFAGRNFSNLNLKDGGGLFADVVTGAEAVVNGVTLTDVGIVLTDGLLAYSSIGIRRQLDATVLLGTKSSASADGRMFVESATGDSLLFVGPQTTPTAKNSKFELMVGQSFTGDITVSQGFHGVMNMGGGASGQVAFLRGVGPKARLNASEWADVQVGGDFAGSINSTDGDTFLTVNGKVAGKARISSESAVELNVVGSVQRGAVISGQNVTLVVDRNFSGSVQSGAGDLLFAVGGSVLKGSSLLAGGNAAVAVEGNFDGSVESQGLRFLVEGNVSKASRIVAQDVSDWLGAGTANFGIGGRFDGIVNVVDFDAAPNFATVTLVGGGAGSSARFYVDRFNTDDLVFNGNFRGNVRVLQDLVANLNFLGNVDRITLGGRVGSYAPSDPVGSITPQLATINVAGRLLYLNTNSYFEALGSGDGVFWNDATKTSSTGALFTGSYGKVVPTLQEVLPPAPPTPQTYTVPSAPGFSASSWQNSPAGILVSFSSSTNNGGLPVVYYQYTTDGGANWRQFAVPTTTSATNLLLTVDSSGNPFVVGSPYSVNVRAVNALGATASSPITVVVPPSAPLLFTALQTAPGATSIGISFSAPAGTGGAPVSYEYTTDGGTTWSPVAGPGPALLTSQSGPGALPFVIGNTYQVTVRATNSAGPGPAFSPISSVLMETP